MKEPIFERAEFLAQNLKAQNVKSAILIILYDLEIPVNCDGFRYLEHSIYYASGKATQIVEKEIFEAVGNMFIPNVEYKNMNNAIHDALKKAWKVRTKERWRYYLPEYIVVRRKAPSNMEFICSIIYFLEFWQDCYEKEADFENV